jgi:hypothetical protein
MAKKKFSEFYIKERNEDRHTELSVSPWGIQHIHNIDNPIRMKTKTGEIKSTKELEEYCKELQKEYLAKFDKISDSYITMIESAMREIKQKMIDKAKEIENEKVQ